MITNQKAIGEQVRKYRKETNLKQEELSGLLGMTRQNVSLIEKRRNTPDS